MKNINMWFKSTALKTAFVVAALIAAILSVSALGAKAQGSMPQVTISDNGEAAFNNELQTAIYSLAYSIDASLVFQTNGQTSLLTGAAMNPGAPTSTDWNITLTIGNGQINAVGTTAFRAPGFDWQWNTVVNSLGPVYNIGLGVEYNATNTQGMTISQLSENGIPVAGTITADQNNPFGELMLSSSTPMTQVNYLLTANTPNPQNVEYEQPGGLPGMSSIFMIPGTVPEPSTLALCCLAIGAFAGKRYISRKK